MQSTKVQQALMVKFSLYIVLFTLLINVIGSGFSQGDYPSERIRVIVHASPGGGTDVMTRLVWRYAEERLGVPVYVENHDGAGGQVGFTELATSPATGYHVGAITTMSIVTHELTREVPYTLQDSFLPIAQVVLDPSAVVVRNDSPFQTMEELLDYALENPLSLTWGGTFLWGAHHVHMELLEQATGAEFIYIPFDGAAESRAQLLGGHIDISAGGVSEYIELVEAGEVRILAMGGTERWEMYPEIPTYQDLGYDIVIGSNRGFAVPGGTPQEIVDHLSEVLADVVQDPGFLEEAERLAIRPTLAFMDAETFRNYLFALQDTMRDLLEDVDTN